MIIFFVEWLTKFEKSWASSKSRTTNLEIAVGLGVVIWKISDDNTAWEVNVFGVFLVCIFSYLDVIRRDTLYLSIFSLNAGKYGPEKTSNMNSFYEVLFQIRTSKEALLLLQCHFTKRHKKVFYWLLGIFYMKGSFFVQCFDLIKIS